MTKCKVFKVFAVFLCVVLLVTILVLPASANIIYDGADEDFFGYTCGFEFRSYDLQGAVLGASIPFEIGTYSLDISFGDYYMETYNDTFYLDVSYHPRYYEFLQSDYFGTVAYANQYFDISYCPGFVPVQHVDNPNFVMYCDMLVELDYVLNSNKSEMQRYVYTVSVPMNKSLDGDGTYSFNEAYSNPIALALGNLLLEIGSNDSVVAYGNPIVEYIYRDGSTNESVLVGATPADYAFLYVNLVDVPSYQTFDYLVSALYEPPITIVEPASSMFDWLGSTLAGVMSVPLFMFGDFPLTIGGLFFSILAVFALFFVFRAFAGG